MGLGEAECCAAQGPSGEFDEWVCMLRQLDMPQGRSMSWKSGQAPHFTSWMRGLEAPERTGGEVPKNVVVSGESRRQLAWRGG